MTTEVESNVPEGADAGAAPDSEAQASEVNPLERVAARMGWAPKETWKDDPEKWVDAETFLNRTPDVLKDLRDRVDRTNRTAQKIIEKERAKAVKDAEVKLAKAKEEGDVDGVEEASAELFEARAENRQEATDSVKEFQERNTWFGKSRGATALAKEAAQEVANRGGSKEEQFAAAEKAVREEFPNLFDADSGTPSPKPAPKVPALQGGQRTASPTPQKRSWNDVPAADRRDMEKSFIRTGMLTQEECLQAYAEEHWKGA